jgi:hypothetical protein
MTLQLRIDTASTSPEIFLVVGNTGLSADFRCSEAAVEIQKAALPNLCAATSTLAEGHYP